MTILQGQAIALFAFDIGYEVSLDRLAELLPASPLQPISRRKQTPSYLQYARPPRAFSLGPTDERLGMAGMIHATMFDFGAVSIGYRFPLVSSDAGLPLDDAPALSRNIYDLDLQTHAAREVERLLERIAPAVTRCSLSPMVEDYYLFIIEQYDGAVRAEDLSAVHGATLAQLLRFETQPLSREQREEALSECISYYEDDLLVVGWNAALIVDQDYEDTVNVMELLNVELLEARYIDGQLDRRIEDYARLVHARADWLVPLRTPYRQAVRELAELRLEASVQAERVDNSLKLVGDLYLARVHAAAARRFHLHEWERMAAHKLGIIDDFYQLFIDRVRTVQSQTLELVIIMLILVELLLALL